MTLTNEDYRYLKHNGRAFKMSRDEIVAAFESMSIPLHEVYVRFQEKYGGYRPDPERVYGIVGKGSFDADEPRTERFHGVDCVRCADDTVTQMPLYLNASGLVYYHDQRIAESFESYLTYKRYSDWELERLKWTYIDDQRRDTKRFQEFLDGRKADTVSEASDPYHTVRRGEDLFWIEIADRKTLYVRPDALKRNNG